MQNLTFVLENSPKSRFFCKTARKPYDKAVCLAILHVKSVAPKSISQGTEDI